jgi:hypothetical protein
MDMIRYGGVAVYRNIESLFKIEQLALDNLPRLLVFKAGFLPFTANGNKVIPLSGVI